MDKNNNKSNSNNVSVVITGTGTATAQNENEENFEQLINRIRSPEGFVVKDRKYLFKTYKSCFIGYDAVDWLYSNVSGLTSREDAVLLGQKLLDTGIINLVSGHNDFIFKDDYLFYEFTKIKNKSCSSSTSSTPPNSTLSPPTSITPISISPNGSIKQKKVSNSQIIVNQIKSSNSIEDITLVKDELIQLGTELMNSEKGNKLQKKKKNFSGPTLSCFSGSTLVDCLVKKLSISRKEGIQIANGLMNLNMFIEVGLGIPIPHNLSSSTSTPNQSSSPLSNSTSLLPPFIPTNSTSSLSQQQQQQQQQNVNNQQQQQLKLFEDKEEIFYEFLTKPESIISHVSMKKLEELCLSHKSLTNIPTTIINTSKYLRILDLSFNSISDFNQLESVSTLYGLEHCNLSHNLLNNLPTSFNRLEKLVKLNLSHNNFVQIPMVVFHIPTLKDLSLCSNQLSSISESIGKLCQLESLDLKNNKIIKVPKELGLLNSLKSLDLSGYNKITELPAFLSSISTLQSLEFNQDTVKFPVKSITSKGFQHIIGYLKDLYEGTITLPYMKLIVLGSERTGKTSLIKSLTKSQQKILKPVKKVSSPDIFTNDPIEITEWNFEIPELHSSLPNVPIITATSALSTSNGSNGSSGSSGLSSSLSYSSLSSLANSTGISNSSLLGNGTNTISASASPKEKKRSGSLNSKRNIKILTYDFKFANQEVYYNTHQFYLSERAFYLITFDINKDPISSQLDFWINSIKSKSPNAPIYLVATMIDQYQGSTNGDIMKPLSEVENFLNQRFLEVTGVIGVSSTTQRNMELLKQEIYSTLIQQSWINEKIPSIYVTLEANLQEEAKKRQPPIVSWEEYQNIAKLSNFTSTEKLIRATHTLNRWGSIIWLDDQKSQNSSSVFNLGNNINTRIGDFVILKPQWLSDCFSQLVAARHTIISQDAILQISSLRQIWKPNLIPESLHFKILKILEKFQLLYTLKSNDNNSNTNTNTNTNNNSHNNNNNILISNDFHKSLPPLLNISNNNLNSIKEESWLPPNFNVSSTPSSTTNSLSLSSSSAFTNPNATTTTNNNNGNNNNSNASLSSFIHPSLIEHFTSNPSLNTSPKANRISMRQPSNSSISAHLSTTSSSNNSNSLNLTPSFSSLIIPCLLPTNKPSQLESLWDTWSGQDQYQIGRYFQFLNSPKICFERLMVRFLFMMDPILYWSNGILFRKNQSIKDSFKNSMTNCGTLVEYDAQSHQLRIKVRGPEFDTCAKLFQIILENMDTILKDYQIHLHHTFIPCSCSAQCKGETPYLYPIEFIENNFDKGDVSIKCPATQQQVSLNKLAPDITLSTVSSNRKIAKEDLVNLEEIGIGGFSKVYKGIYKGNQVVAIKQLNFERMDIGGLIDPILQNSIFSTSTNSNQTSSSLSSSGSIGRYSVFQPPSKLLQRNSSVSSISSNSSSSDDSSAATSAALNQSRMAAINEFRREVWLMSSLSHPNIISMKGFSFDPYAIVMEYMDLGNLSNYLLQKKREGTTLSWDVIFKIALDIASGMSFLHNSTPPLVHRDLKSPNILVSTQPDEPYIVAKVSDFGLSRSVVQGFVSKVVDNPTWLAPEVLKASEYNEKGDVYSFGIILWELYHMEIPFDEFDFKFMSTLEDKIIDGIRPSISQNCNQMYSSLIQRCWNPDPLLRPSFDNILKIIQEIKCSTK